jgi:hypothetical protein
MYAELQLEPRCWADEEGLLGVPLLRRLLDSISWSGCPDSNRGPLGPKPSALTWLSYTPMSFASMCR